jgi:ketosteroid isomerase-like protein
MTERVLPPVATTISFIDRINRGDLEGLTALMTADHVLQVFDEPALVGKDANTEAWAGYASKFSKYVIYPHRIAALGGRVAIVGHTTGSHLGRPDAEEAALTVIWVADVEEGLLHSWQLMEDSPENRASLGLDRV